MPPLSGSRLPGSPALRVGGTLPGSRLPGLPALGNTIPATKQDYGSGLFGLAAEKAATHKVAEWEERRQRYKKLLIEKGLSPAAAESASRIAIEKMKQNFDRPTPVLSAIGRGLRSIEFGGAGFLSGFVNRFGAGGGNPLEAIANIGPAFGAGASQAIKAVGGEKGFGEYIAEAHPTDPVTGDKDWIARNAGTIGFTMSLVFDPTLYLSFGATAPAKIAATRALAESTKVAMVRAKNIIENKGGFYWNTKYHDPVELAQQIRMNEGFPLDLGESLQQLRKVGQQYKVEARRGQQGIRAAVGGYLLPTAARGGRGMRFAGMEIPGTVSLGAKIGKATRGKLSRSLEADSTIAGGMTRAFLTSPQLRVMGDDTLRALALTEMATMKAELQGARIEAEDLAAGLVRQAPEPGVRPQPVPLKERMGALERPIINLDVPLSEDMRKRVLRAAQETETAYPMEETAGSWTERLSDEPTYHVAAGYKVPAPGEGAVADFELAQDFSLQLEEALGRAANYSEAGFGEASHGFYYDTMEEAQQASVKINDLLKSWGLKGDAVVFREGKESGLLLPESLREVVDELKASSRPLTPESVSQFDFLGRRAPESFQKEIPFHRELLRRTETEIAKASGLKPETASLIRQIHDRIPQEVEAATAVKINERETRELWAQISKDIDDPVEAIAQFVFQNQIRVRSRQFIERMLDNPLFAKEIPRGDVALPPGFKPFIDHRRKRFAVVGEIADALEEFKNPQYLDKSTQGALRLLQMPQNFWKQFATSPNPSFHVMNFLGAMWNNLAGGIYNPADYVKALATLYRSRIEEAAQYGERFMGRETVSMPKTQVAAQTVREARVRGATHETASIFAEISEGTERFHRLTTEAPASVRARLEDLVKRRPRESRKRYTLRQTRRGTAVGLLATGNPIGAALLAPEAVVLGRKLGTTIEDIVRLAPFMKAAHDPVLTRYLETMGPIRVPGLKHPTLSKEMQVAQYDIGAEISKHFQFDYSNLTEFERRWAKTIFPFYTFYRNNFVLQAKLLGQSPRMATSFLHAQAFANENADLSPDFRSFLPEYFDNLSAVAIPVPVGIRKQLGLPLDDPLFLNPKLPLMSLNLMPPIWELFRNPAAPTKQKVLGVFAPMLGSIGPFAPLPIPGMKPMLEAIVGEQLGLNRTLDYQRAQSNDWRNSWVPAPIWVKHLPEPLRDFMGIFPWGDVKKNQQGDYIMTATGQYILETMSAPFITNLGRAIPTGGPGFEAGKAKADMISWLTGIRIIPVDTLRMHRSWAYRLRSMLEGQRADLKDQGKDLDPEDMRSLRLVRAQLKVLERAWDTRERELYGDQNK